MKGQILSLGLKHFFKMFILLIFFIKSCAKEAFGRFELLLLIISV